MGGDKKRRKRRSGDKNEGGATEPHDQQIEKKLKRPRSGADDIEKKTGASNPAPLSAPEVSKQKHDGVGSQRNKKSKPNDDLHSRPPNLTSSSHAFEVDDSDHCETPLEAYRDVLEILDKLTRVLGKTRSSVRIFDPYYCDGGVQRKLKSLGFMNVINKNEDFYANISNKSIPDHDILVTNPPYSGQHMEKLLRFASSPSQASIPFLLLLPHFVYTKDYYSRSGIPRDTFFLVPKTRYSYLPPKWVSQQSGSTAIGKGKVETSPFPSFWYCHHAGVLDKNFLVDTYGQSGKYDAGRKVQYACRTEDIPRDVKGEFDSTKKRPNPKARKRLAAKRRQEQEQKFRR